jgi:hypothetical protein
MYSKILRVLESVADMELNLASPSGREYLAFLLNYELKKNDTTIE